MFSPSKTDRLGQAAEPMVIVCRMAAFESSFKSVPAVKSVTHMFDPSKTGPPGSTNPTVAVVTVQGSVGPGVMIEIEPELKGPFAVQIRAPSNAMLPPWSPRPLATVVTAPAG